MKYAYKKLNEFRIYQYRQLLLAKTHCEHSNKFSVNSIDRSMAFVHQTNTARAGYMYPVSNL